MRAEQAGGGAQRRDNLVGRGVVHEVDAVRQGGKAETRRVEVHAGDAQGRLAGLVEGQLERIAAEQVDAVEGGILCCAGDVRQRSRYTA